MPSEAPPDDLDFQVRHFIGGLCDVVARYLERNGSAAALVATIIARLCRRRDRLIALVARFKAGMLLAPRRADAPRPHSAAPRPPDPVPRCRGFLVGLLRHEAAVYGRILDILLADPEMVAFLAASPQGGRLLRPLWRMLSPRRYPPILQPPPRETAAPSPRAARGCPASRPEWSRVSLAASPNPQRSPPRDGRLSRLARPIPT